MKKLVLVRHGQSIWNEQNRFTGWTDVDLSEKGLLEARRAGRILKFNGYEFDIGYTSYLKRAIRTLWIILDELNLEWIPIYKSWMLNERHYGDLQGFDKKKITKKYGKEQVFKWRRGVKITPPPLKINDKRYPGFDIRYKNLRKDQIPLTENLIDTEERVLRFWFKKIVPEIKNDKKVIISAHGNTIRALVRYLDNVPDDGIVNLNIPTATPLIYELDDNLTPLKHYYLDYKGVIPKENISENIDNKNSYEYKL